jgi:hypothetical protein
LIEGLEQADVIAPGRLFAGRRGGCAVGVTLRVLYPHYQGRRVIWGRRLRRSIARLRREHAQEISHLYALEQVFDRSIELLCEQFYWVPGGELAIATASWVADEARTELVLRELNSDWLDRIMAARQAPAPREPAAATAPALSMA